MALDNAVKHIQQCYDFFSKIVRPIRISSEE